MDFKNQVFLRVKEIPELILELQRMDIMDEIDCPGHVMKTYLMEIFQLHSDFHDGLLSENSDRYEKWCFVQENILYDDENAIFLYQFIYL